MQSKIALAIFLVFCTIQAMAQKTSNKNIAIVGTVVDGKTNTPIESASVRLISVGTITVTNEAGIFHFKQSENSSEKIEISAVGFETKTIDVAALQLQQTILLQPKQAQLMDVKVLGNAGDQYKPISKMDIQMRGVSNSQEVLRIVPGLFIGQHQGGGKAEQIFLRGFDCDHGTDISLNVDGMPINMVSQAHGQGFADSHFIIPELIDNVNFKKGLYDATKGNFTTSGSVDFHTADVLTENTVQLESGMFNTYRALGMFNLLGEKAKANQQSWYLASEYRYSDSYFDNPQHFNRFNFFTKYHGKISPSSMLNLTASTFYSIWDASGQIPERAVAEGLIGFYGAIDPTEGGKTSRTNFNAQLLTTLNNGDLIKNQLYYSNVHFDLHTNFTFFLNDPINGDQIRQREARNMLGYNGSYNHVGYIGNTKFTTEAGINFRFDKTMNSELSHTKDRYTLINNIKLGDIAETDAAAYISETVRFSPKFSMNAGLRFDQFINRYNNKFAGDTTLNGIGLYKANANILSPKLNFYYHANDKTEFYFTAGKGFHSNDTRVVVAENGRQILPPAYGSDLGTVFKPLKNVIVNVALWYIWLDQEFVYGGDDGAPIPSGKTQREGFDFSIRYQPISNIYVDADVNYAHGRSVDDPKGENYIPLAPVWSSTGGITYTNKNGFTGSLRYRYLGDRAANEDYSLTAVGYFVNDLVLNYTQKKITIGLTINNLFNVKWKETQFETLSRLKNETAPVDEICFTPGTKFAVKVGVTYRF